MISGARNTGDGFGWVSRALHWVMALAVIAMLPLGTVIADMQPSLSTLWLFGLHKSIGLTLLAALVLRLLWHRISPPPAPLSDGVAAWQMRAARAVHLALYALLLVVPLSGWLGSAATGIDTVWFDVWTLPAVVPASERLEGAFFAVHGVATKLLLLCLALHIGGALDRHFRKGDRTLRRMLLG